MKRNLTTLPTGFLSLLIFMILQGNVWSHSEEHIKEVPAHDSLRTEFGDFNPAMTPERMVRVVMTDNMKFVPEVLHFRKDEIVKFIFTNNGELIHEFVMGSPQELERHVKLMTTKPAMEHEEPHMIHLDPGDAGSLTWKFSQVGEFTFACLIPGHFEAGMRGKIIVRNS